MPTDEERVNALLAKWQPLEDDSAVIEADLYALIRSVREDREAPAELPPPTPASASVTRIMQRAEPKIQAMLARVGPRNATPAEAARAAAEAKREIGLILKDTMIESGMSEASATSLSAVFLALTNVTPKRK